MQPLVEVRHLSLQREGLFLLEEVDWVLHRGEHWAIVGDTGSGKTLFTQCLCGEIPHEGTIRKQVALSMLRVPQQHVFTSRSNIRDHYYQQRFHSQDAEDALTVREYLAGLPDQGLIYHWINKLNLSAAMDRSLLLLSNGEHKRLQILRALLLAPDILILDQPFTGLDTAGRKILIDLLYEWTQSNLQLIIITPPTAIPSVTTHVAEFKQGKMVFAGDKERFASHNAHQNKERVVLPAFPSLQEISAARSFQNAVQLHKVNVQYGEKNLLKNINWKVERSQRWLLWGPNGAGKSTLLSLLYADNPQAYANEIYLFDRRRGTGETIWEIKQNIGFVSPELHLYFEADQNVFDVVASGLFDTMGLFRRLAKEQEAIVLEWLEVLQLSAWRHRSIRLLSVGQQRLVLLARAMVKLPPLLLLDEPCQGMDDAQCSRFNNLVDAICRRMGTSLIYVTHDRRAIPDCIEHLIELENGQIRYCGPIIPSSTEVSSE